MAPGSKLDSCKRTSFSTFAFWVLIWLTCLFLEKSMAGICYQSPWHRSASAARIGPPS
ncbi:hypothetical protein PTTG_29523 [Puccinia triticina 1-1 BBBD Race 1]|uniref:Uncharacterized protein n=1 Tax=Puccinia triticina (isolate 1-1 / race 1 (BBBD)) TaxID=630390 RepID=A0A180G3H8_PUCT1|nr:hypothetical protein PTTG_29523 [Puccinia triticina 1-1 BBBD Race 1]